MIKNKIRAAVVDDSNFMRLLISDIVTSEGDIEVVATASNGKEACDMVKESKPDVLLLDMMMPEFDGKYAVENIMRETPTPIVILSALGNSNINPIMECLELGAFDYINKPNKNVKGLRGIDSEIISKVRQASKSDLEKLRKGKRDFNLNPHTFSKNVPYDVIVIGSSTGGPGALETVVSKLPVNLVVPVLIAQHMPSNFVPSFARRLNDLIPLNVKQAEKGMFIESGNIYLAPGDKNMIVRKAGSKFMIDWTDETYKEYNYPSVNALMLSAAKIFRSRTIGVIMTGMGKDGTLGMKSIKEAGGMTIAQNKESCVVFGMPKEAIESGSIDNIVPLDEIGGFLVSALS